jgi:uncharacterized protein with PQ loop repeat
MNQIIQESIGFLAGAVVTTAALPRVVDILRNHDIALNESYSRNAMLVIGNLIWIVYGITGGALDRLDLDAAVPDAVRARMREPIQAERHTTVLPVFDPAQLEPFRG